MNKPKNNYEAYKLALKLVKIIGQVKDILDGELSEDSK